VTLYRDTNGWCPFCERVWVALRAKKVPYRESLISLQNKPQWYKDLVPTTLVPAVLFHVPNATERRIVWESMEILKALDEAFPETPRLMQDEMPEWKEFYPIYEAVQSAGVHYVYGSRNATLSDEEKGARRQSFSDALDQLDKALQDGPGPFCLGEKFTGMDAIMIPTMERWRYQLPVTHDLDILDGRPGIQAWFEAMDAFEPYTNRVAGDAYSWTATASMFLRYFGGGEDKPEVAAAIERADKKASELAKSFSSVREELSDTSFSLEAAAKLLSNHEAVVQDCNRQDPVSQKHIPRASDPEIADTVLRYVTSILVLAKTESCLQLAKAAPLVEVPNRTEGALAARTVAARLCVPRDMSAPAAKVLRGVLSIVADRLEQE
jgi:glutathione S-transferase